MKNLGLGRDGHPKTPRRVFYAAGPGDVIVDHRFRKEGIRCPSEVSVTFSSQIEDFCQSIGASAYFVSCHPNKSIEHDDPFILENMPKPMPGAGGVKYHLAQIIQGLRLLRSAVWFKSDLALIDSGSTYYFMLPLFSLFGMRVIPILHNALWPKGFPPTRPVARAILKLDKLFFWRNPPEASVCVSPECERQILSVVGRVPGKRITYVALAQFYRDHFEKISKPPRFEDVPFQIIFVGRMVSEKGIFDILEMARKIEDRLPGRVRWVLCGTGPDLERLRAVHEKLKLGSTVEIRGWTSPADQIPIYSRSHAAIVPTRSDFAEAMAMTAIESILAGRPLITNDVVPALELLKPACVEARTDDIESYVQAITHLVGDKVEYERLCLACMDVGEQFYDRSKGLAAVLERAISAHT